MTDGPQNIFTKEQIDEIKDLIKNADKHFVDFSKMESENQEDMIDKLTVMMRSARTEEERENFRKMIDQLSR